ncbi:DNA-3-methyladenine glycosylase I [uncultured Treponema sp.]|uniref:DNA-3-methyladenine glycosylase I n=1 Tax=uncultured Treponema sp. TaxID=162155 RepID=UPI0025EB2F84|nr:DNA-3-methyladenine glycosylase I [uncultured Treponema sp.]
MTSSESDSKNLFDKNLPRCNWCNLKNPKYIDYHDNEWGSFSEKSTDDKYLFEMLTLESFQAGLSWECVLNKREDFRSAYDGFDLEKVCGYGEEKIAELLANPKIIRNRLKIKSSISNARIFRTICLEYGSFFSFIKKFLDEYLCNDSVAEKKNTKIEIIEENSKNKSDFSGIKIIHETGKATNGLSDSISAELKKRGMKFMGSTIVYSFLQAIGVIFSHGEECFLFRD